VTLSAGVTPYNEHDAVIKDLSWNPSSEYELSTGSQDHVIKCWNLAARFGDPNRSDQWKRGAYTHSGGDLNRILYTPFGALVASTYSKENTATLHLLSLERMREVGLRHRCAAPSPHSPAGRLLSRTRMARRKSSASPVTSP
jgi:WD40 repeat protein